MLSRSLLGGSQGLVLGPRPLSGDFVVGAEGQPAASLPWGHLPGSSQRSWHFLASSCWGLRGAGCQGQVSVSHGARSHRGEKAGVVL